MDGLPTQDRSGLDDFAASWLRLQKTMRTYESAAAINEWQIALDAATEMRHLAIQLFLFAQGKVDGQGRS